MKKSGIILCIFAAILVVCGILLCTYAKKSAQARGENIYDSANVSGEDNVDTIEITDNMNYITVDYDYVNINVYGNSDKNCIELINFTDNDYSKKSAGVTVSTSKDIISVAYDTLKNFNGIRNLLFPDRTPSGSKTVNIYLNGDYNITQLKFSVKNGDINVSDLESNTDYTLSISGNGNATMTNITTKSNIKVNVNEAKVSFTNVDYASLAGQSTNGNVYLIEKDINAHLYDTTVESGCIYVNDESQGTNYKQNKATSGKTFTYSVKTGNIYVNQSENTEDITETKTNNTKAE